MNNKYLFLIAGLLVGFWIAKRGNAKKIEAAVSKVSDEVTAEISSGIDTMLEHAEKQGLTVTQVRENFKNAA